VSPEQLVESLAEIESMAMNILVSKKSRDGETVRRIVGGFAQHYFDGDQASAANATEEVARRIEARLVITMNDAAVIQEDFDP
jgi:hypothetical protein